MNSQVAGIVFVFSLLLSVYWTFTNKIVLTGKSALAQSITMKQTEEREAHVIIKTNGEVFFQRDEDEEEQFHPASVGTRLYDGDLLQVKDGAEVVVRCADQTQWDVPAGESGVNRGCRKKYPSHGGRAPSRGGDEETALQIVSPRNGINLTYDKVTIRWKTISEATRYTVRVVQSVNLEDKVIWEKEVEIGNGKEEAEVVFQPADDRPEQDKIAYFVKVKAHRENLPAQEVEEKFYLLNEQ